MSKALVITAALITAVGSLSMTQALTGIPVLWMTLGSIALLLVLIRILD